MRRNNSKRTGGIRMAQMLSSEKVKFRGGQCIDLWDQQVLGDVFVTVTTRVDQCNHYWVTQCEETK